MLINQVDMPKFINIIINIIAITLIAYLCVDAFYRIVGWWPSQENINRIVIGNEPEKERFKNKPVAGFQAISKSTIFGSVKKIPDKTPQEVEALAPTTLNIALLGTVVEDQENSIAVIEEKGKRSQGLYRVGDTIQNGVIKSILRGKVVLRVGDKDEVLLMPEPASSASPTSVAYRRQVQPPPIPTTTLDRTITIRQQDLDRSMENIDNLLEQVRIVPHKKDGVQDGLVITGISAGSIFRRMGLRNGDIIKSVNDESALSNESILDIYNDLQTGEEVSLTIERRGLERTLNYRLR